MMCVFTIWVLIFLAFVEEILVEDPKLMIVGLENVTAQCYWSRYLINKIYVNK